MRYALPRRAVIVVLAVLFAGLSLFAGSQLVTTSPDAGRMVKQATGVTVPQQRAEAAVVAFRVSPSSERGMRLCSLKNGRGCRSFNPGNYAAGVASFRQDAGCEYWASGVRKFKRESKVMYRNYTETIGHLTGALRNCRNTGRGDVVVE